MATQASGKLEQKSTRCRTIPYQTHVALLYCVITCVVRSSRSCRRRTHKQGRGQLTQAPECGPASLGVCLNGPQYRAMQGQRGRQEGREWVSGGADRQIADYYWGVETEAAPLGPSWFRCWGAIIRGSLTREIGRARMERIDGASRGKKKSWSLFPAYVLRGNERAAEPGVHALPRASRNRMFADASLFEVSSRGPRLLPLRVWRMAFLGTWKGLHS
jgi:hypothetical protein